MGGRGKKDTKGGREGRDRSSNGETSSLLVRFRPIRLRYEAASRVVNCRWHISLRFPSVYFEFLSSFASPLEGERGAFWRNDFEKHVKSDKFPTRVSNRRRRESSQQLRNFLSRFRFEIFEFRGNPLKIPNSLNFEKFAESLSKGHGGL